MYVCWGGYTFGLEYDDEEPPMLTIELDPNQNGYFLDWQKVPPNLRTAVEIWLESWRGIFPLDVYLTKMFGDKL
jgi:hypothetical protein